MSMMERVDDSDARRERPRRPWSVVAGGALLLTYEALYIAVGLYALIYGSWEELAALGTIFGLMLGTVGLVFLAFTVPVLLGRRFARFVLLGLTAAVVVVGVRATAVLVANPVDYSYNAGYWILVTIGPPASTLLPLLAVLLLFLPPSTPFFARRTS